MEWSILLIDNQLWNIRITTTFKTKGICRLSLTCHLISIVKRSVFNFIKPSNSYSSMLDRHWVPGAQFSFSSCFKWVAQLPPERYSASLHAENVNQFLKAFRSSCMSRWASLWQCSTPFFKDSYGSTVMNMLESREVANPIDWQAKNNITKDL